MAENKVVLLSLVVLFLSFLIPLTAALETHDREHQDVRVGLVADLSSMEGKIIRSCISMALLDFYKVNEGYRTRVSVQTKDSNGDPLQALATAVDLLETERVDILIGAQSSLEAKLLAELSEKAKVPMISFQPLSFFSLKKYNYVVQVSHNEISEAEGIAAFINGYNWDNVALVYEDGDDWRKSMELWENRIKVNYKWSFSALFNEVDIIQQLQALKKLENRVFVVHMSEELMSRLFSCARRLRMLDEGYAWIVTANSMNRLHYKDYFVRESMQGVIGFRTHIPLSKELHNFTSRLRRTFHNEEAEIEFRELSVFGVWARDVVWSVAMAAETASIKGFRKSYNSKDFLEEISHNRFDGLSGNVQFVDRKLVSNRFDIVNIFENSERRVGFWSSGQFTKNLHTDRRQLSSSSSSSDNGLEAIIWPGGSARIPKGRFLRETRKKLRILVPTSNRFKKLMEVNTDPVTNKTTAKGFCIEVFETAIQSLDYEFEYFPWRNGSVDRMTDQIFVKNYDGAVGDITITSNRSLYVDFTLPFTELGTGIVAPKDKNMWIFLKPLTTGLWITSGLFFVLTGFVVWLIERPVNSEFQGSWSEQLSVMLWFGFSTLVFAHREGLNHNLSRFVVLVWIFSVLILTSNYTATLTAMMTVQQIRLKGNADVGHLSGSSISGDVNSTHNGVSNSIPLLTPDDFAKALTAGTKNGGVSVIVDEIPYLRVFLGLYPSGYSVVKTQSNTNGFGFMFQKGSKLASEVSTEIAKLREKGRLQEMESSWFKNDLPYSSDDSSDPLTLSKFRGLFIINGTCFGFALLLLTILRLRAHRATRIRSTELQQRN